MLLYFFAFKMRQNLNLAGEREEREKLDKINRKIDNRENIKRNEKDKHDSLHKNKYVYIRYR